MYLPAFELIVTNEHVVRDNATVVIGSATEAEQLAEVVYLDPYYDLAFLRTGETFELPDIPVITRPLDPDQPLISLSQHFGQPLRTSYGRLIESGHSRNNIDYLLHDAWQEAGNGGGPLFTADGGLVGINMYGVQEGRERTLSLPMGPVMDCLRAFNKGGGRVAARCFNCREITFEVRLNQEGYCPNCGAELQLPNMIEDAPPTGVNATIEAILSTAGYDPKLARRGPNLWNIHQGSARIQVAYHEDSGLVTGDAHLCRLPEQPEAELYEFMLRENYQLQQLTLSTYGKDILLSLLIYDRYLAVETGLPRFEHLFAKADDYDNLLVERYGASWID